MRKTKIVCTLGPATDSVLRELMLAGMDIARINFSHGTHEQHQERIDAVKKIREELDLPVALLLDSKGPEVRIGTFENGGATLKQDDIFTLSFKPCVGTQEHVYVDCEELKTALSIGDYMFIDDGNIKLRVKNISSKEIQCTVIDGGVVRDRKSVNVPGVPLHMKYISENDEKDIIFGIKNGFDYIAASFTRTANDVYEIKKFIDDNNGSHIHIIAKIENREGIDNIDEIIELSDGIMVARGDLGIEIPFEEIPKLQKILIKKAYSSGKKVITATQMLESMIGSPRPTRAETTDVANAIYDGTSSLMLSGETAIGKYPLEALRTMCKIAEYTENSIDYIKRFNRTTLENTNVADAISHATVTTAHDLGASAIITVTKTGTTARMISKYRPACPIITCTTDECARRQLNMSWGVIPFMIEECTNTDELFDNCINIALRENLVKNGDIVPITTGTPLGIPGTTNTLKVQIVGNILVSGTGISKKIVSANVCAAASEQELRDKFHDGDIVVISETSNNIMDILRKCSGIITEKGGFSSHAAVVGLSLDIPVIFGAQFAADILKCGTTITMDSEGGHVYSGIIINV